MYKPISDEPDRFKLWLDPDGVYRVDGRVIPVADDISSSRLLKKSSLPGLELGFIAEMK